MFPIRSSSELAATAARHGGQQDDGRAVAHGHVEPAELAPSCGAAGVLGVMAGVMGLLQANEVIKLVVGIGEPLIGRLLLFDALTTTFTEVALRRDPDCPVCGDAPTITEYVDYVEFCAR